MFLKSAQPPHRFCWLKSNERLQVPGPGGFARRILPALAGIVLSCAASGTGLSNGGAGGGEFRPLAASTAAESGGWFARIFTANERGELELIVSPGHSRDLAVFARAPGRADGSDDSNQRLRKPEEIEASFRTLEQQSDAYCTALFSGRSFSQADLVLLAADRRESYTRNRHPDSLYSLRAGCRNFFEMNDFRPDRDFALVRALYPTARFDCYSVGLLQPYLMHSMLGCDRLTFIDINWRILSMHRDLLARVRAGAFASDANVNRDLAGLLLKFPALQVRPTQPRPAAIEHLCRSIQHSFCRRILPEFRAAFFKQPPANLRLNLSTLHDGAYAAHSPTADDGRSVRVIYLSNAIEESYTSRSEFETLLRNLSESAAPRPERPAVDLLIHHVGGWKLFGLYELRHSFADDSSTSDKRMELRTLCKDRYLSKSRSRPGDSGAVEYTTYFEQTRLKNTAIAGGENRNGNGNRIPGCGAAYAGIAE
ncbi:MAG: hypothetical protein NXI24_18770 [bacterium]|nr:hypothetical protein [bacterium]